MTQALLGAEGEAPVRVQLLILILILSVQARRDGEGRCEPAGLEPLLTV